MTVNHKRVERVMREYGIAGLHLRKKVRTTIAEADASPVSDLLQRDFIAERPNTRYVGDITYLLAGGGWFLYLATVVDLCSRRLAGWSIADCMRAPSSSSTRCRPRRRPGAAVWTARCFTTTKGRRAARGPAADSASPARAARSAPAPTTRRPSPSTRA
ncbi:hypothetical protein HCN51_50005 [Nonomuraea sp. FMUSA5-5]|uniref:Integrase catalytic domain-containing protein n=1 Tax=Nonomuraea composti TaxID=2720023 RepID=A0ABX1BKF9_9ACTN|nr:hypothetical protein [Nonomuraea sp. FMUSA5-5]